MFLKSDLGEVFARLVELIRVRHLSPPVTPRIPSAIYTSQQLTNTQLTHLALYIYTAQLHQPTVHQQQGKNMQHAQHSQGTDGETDLQR